MRLLNFSPRFSISVFVLSAVVLVTFSSYFIDDNIWGTNHKLDPASRVPKKGPGKPPIFAYWISGTQGEGKKIFRLLKAVYHPRNRYLLHLDAGCTAYERNELARLVLSERIFQAFSNVDVVGKAYAVDRSGSSVVAATLHGASVLLKIWDDWDWFITLSASDYPVVTQDDLLYAFTSLPRDLNFIDHTSELGWKELSVHEASTIPSAVEKSFNEVQDGNAAGPDQLMEADASISVGAILQPQDVFKESLEAPKNYEMALPTEEQIGGISAPEDSLVFASIADKNNGDVIPETETLQLESITPAEPSITKNSGDQVEFQAINSMQVDLDAAFNNPHPTTDSEPPNGNPQIQEEPVGPSEKFETSSNLAEMSEGDPTTTSASYGGGPAASFSEGDLEPTSDVSIGIRKTRASTNASKAKPVEPMLTEPPEPSSGNKRKAKKVVKQKKWRG